MKKKDLRCCGNCLNNSGCVEQNSCEIFGDDRTVGYGCCHSWVFDDFSFETRISEHQTIQKDLIEDAKEAAAEKAGNNEPTA